MGLEVIMDLWNKAIWTVSLVWIVLAIPGPDSIPAGPADSLLAAFAGVSALGGMLMALALKPTPCRMQRLGIGDGLAMLCSGAVLSGQ